MPVTKQFINDLNRLGFKQWVPAQTCSECGNAPGAMDSKKPHALQEEYNKIKKDKSLKPAQRKNLLLEVNKILNSTSRCCGADLAVVYVSYYDMLYERWKSRFDNMIVKFIDTPVIDDKRKIELMPSIRKRYGKHEQYHDDDFIIMHELFGLGDSMTGDLIRIFREEDQRQLEQKEPEVGSEPAPSIETEFLDWIQNIA